jgi:hypothetical protein
MKSRTLIATLLLAAACGAHPESPAPVARLAQGLDQGEGPGDNEWKIYVVGYETGYVQSPQATPPADVYNFFKAYRPDFCKNGEHGPACMNNAIAFSLEPNNVRGPLPPDTAYSPKVVRHYIDGEKQLMAFINQSDMNAASVRASLDLIQGWHSAIMGRAAFPDQVKQRRQDVKDDVTGKLTKVAEATIGPEKAALADSKLKIANIKAYTDEYVKASTALATDFQSLTVQYRAYRATESSSFDAINKIAQTAKDADLTTIAALKQQLGQLSSSESLQPEQIVLDTGRLSSELTQVQAHYDKGLEPLIQFMKDKSFKKPDETTVALHSLSEMYAYCLGREGQITQAILRVYDGLNRRTQGLLAQATDQATRDTMVKTAQLRSSSAYIADVNTTRDSLWKTLPQSTKLKLSYLSDKFDEMTAFLQRETLCTGTVPDYMQTGCNLMKPDFTKAHDWLNKTGPSTIRIQLLLMKQAKLPQDRIDAITAELAAGKTRQAAGEHDALLATSDLVPDSDPPVDGAVPYVDESEDD